MSISKYKEARNVEIKRKALELYKQGFTLREIGDTLNMSYEWIRKGIQEVEKIDKT